MASSLEYKVVAALFCFFSILFFEIDLQQTPSAVGGVKSMLRSLDIGRLSSYVGGLMIRPQTSIRHELAAYARDHGVVI